MRAFAEAGFSSLRWTSQNAAKHRVALQLADGRWRNDQSTPREHAIRQVTRWHGVTVASVLRLDDSTLWFRASAVRVAKRTACPFPRPKTTDRRRTCILARGRRRMDLRSPRNEPRDRPVPRLPVLPEESIARLVSHRFSNWADDRGTPTDRSAATACRLRYDFR